MTSRFILPILVASITGAFAPALAAQAATGSAAAPRAFCAVSRFVL